MQKRVLLLPDKKAKTKSIKLLNFLKLELTTMTNATQQITQFYQEILERQPDPEGLNHWLNLYNQGTSLSTIRHYIALSEESTNNIKDLYTSILGRSAEEGGLNTWLNVLAEGQTLEVVRRQGIAYSLESYNNLNSIFQKELETKRSISDQAWTYYRDQLATFDSTTGNALENVKNKIIATNGGITFTGADYNEIFYGEAGNDSFIGSGGNDSILGDNGHDLVDYRYLDQAITLLPTGIINKGNFGQDQLTNIEQIIANPLVSHNTINVSSTSSGVYVIADIANSSLHVFNAIPNKTLTFTVNYFDDIIGSQGNDTLKGDNQYNDLTGLSGNDYLVGGGGNDTLTGGSGADFFVFNSLGDGVDKITDFTPSALADFNPKDWDRIIVSQSGFGASSLKQFSYNSLDGSLSFLGTKFAELTPNLPFNVNVDITFVV